MTKGSKKPKMPKGGEHMMSEAEMQKQMKAGIQMARDRMGKGK